MLEIAKLDKISIKIPAKQFDLVKVYITGWRECGRGGTCQACRRLFLYFITNGGASFVPHKFRTKSVLPFYHHIDNIILYLSTGKDLSTISRNLRFSVDLLAGRVGKVFGALDAAFHCS